MREGRDGRHPATTSRWLRSSRRRTRAAPKDPGGRPSAYAVKRRAPSRDAEGNPRPHPNEASGCGHWRLDESTTIARPSIDLIERTLGEFLAFELLIADRLRQIVEKPEVRVHRLEVFRICLAKISIEGAEHRRRRRENRLHPGHFPREVYTREQSSR